MKRSRTYRPRKDTSHQPLSIQTAQQKRRPWYGSWMGGFYPLPVCSTCLLVSLPRYFNGDQDVDQAIQILTARTSVMQSFRDSPKTPWVVTRLASCTTGLAQYSSYHMSVCSHRLLPLHQHELMHPFLQIIFQIPATVISKLFPPRMWMAGSAIGWGVSSTLMVSAYGPLFESRLQHILRQPPSTLLG